MTTQILALDIAGNPFDWILPEDAILYYATNKVAWELGDREFIFRGGYSRSGVQSRITIKPIIAIAGSEIMARMLKAELPLTHHNDLLFKRD
ncbi:MAG: putative nuclease, partial [Paucimonas sp.]|nr:putative nuclease [Paucimonas sp.]